MSILFYNKKSQTAISDDPILPNEAELVEKEYDSGSHVTINESQPYYIKFYQAEVPPSFEEVPFYKKELPGNLFEINFKNYVGLTRVCDINLYVQNNKISDVLYDSMLEYITGKYANLIFSFNKSVGLEYSKGGVGKDIPFIQYLFLKKYLLDQKPGIKEITGLILSEPHRKLETEIQKCSIGEMDHFDSSLVLNLLSETDKIIRLPAGHTLLSTPLGNALYERTGNNYYLSDTKRIRKYHTFDTNENRFVKHFLNEVLRELNFLEKIVGPHSGTYLNPNITENITKLTRLIKYLLADPIWSEVGRMSFIPIQSTVLQKREGYRHLFQLYSLLRLLTRYRFMMKDFRNLIEIKDVPTLFEYWCFFLVKDILDNRSSPLKYPIIAPPADTDKKVQGGIMIEYEGNVSLSYITDFRGSPGAPPELSDISNYQTSASYSHKLSPDIVITKNGGEKLILDAKYKGKNGSGGFYGEDSSGTISTYKKEDLDKMHTYKDALKNVYGAFALYPGDDIAIYPSHKATGPFEGVGALPLKPISGGKPHTEHIKNVKKAITAFLDS